MGNTAANIQRRREEREHREREEEAQRQQREKKEEARKAETPQSTEEAVAKQRQRTERSESEMDTEGGGEAGTYQLLSRRNKRHMTNIYFTDSDEKAIVDFVKDHEELFDKTNKHFKDKARKDCLWERFTSSHKLSVKVFKTWFKSHRTHYRKFSQSKYGQPPRKYQRGRTGFRTNLTSLRHTSDGRDSAGLQVSSPWPEEPVQVQPQHTVSLEALLTPIAWRSVCNRCHTTAFG